jgi:hypothetical protein
MGESIDLLQNGSFRRLEKASKGRENNAIVRKK